LFLNKEIIPQNKEIVPKNKESEKLIKITEIKEDDENSKSATDLRKTMPNIQIKGSSDQLVIENEEEAENFESFANQFAQRDVTPQKFMYTSKNIIHEDIENEDKSSNMSSEVETKEKLKNLLFALSNSLKPKEGEKKPRRSFNPPPGILTKTKTNKNLQNFDLENKRASFLKRSETANLDRFVESPTSKLK
jgi:hypothetical protein